MTDKQELDVLKDKMNLKVEVTDEGFCIDGFEVDRFNEVEERKSIGRTVLVPVTKYRLLEPRTIHGGRMEPDDIELVERQILSSIGEVVAYIKYLEAQDEISHHLMAALPPADILSDVYISIH